MFILLFSYSGYYFFKSFCEFLPSPQSGQIFLYQTAIFKFTWYYNVTLKQESETTEKTTFSVILQNNLFSSLGNNSCHVSQLLNMQMQSKQQATAILKNTIFYRTAIYIKREADGNPPPSAY